MGEVHVAIAPRSKPKWEEGDFKVRAVTGVEEVEKYHWRWAKDEQWNPGLDDPKLFFAADPKGFFVGEYKGEVVSCMSVVVPESDPNRFGFVGYYIVAPEHRGKGFGFRMWMEALSRGSGHVLGLDGVVPQQGFYSSVGFKVGWNNMKYQCDKPLPPPPMFEVDGIEVIANNFDAKLAGEYEKFQPRSEGWLHNWATAEVAQNVMAISKSSGKCVGFGIAHKAVVGNKLCPVIADSPSLGKHILVKLISLLGDSVGPESPVTMNVPDCNPASLEIVKSLGFTPVFETARMWKGAPPKLPIHDKIFVVTTLELG
eukprot:TRINITY_DN8137_c1_g1_i3.p1 TRINITY_DN8137_c1_g1~~TRINITY_DN8137_c1_g1_i3.p1  ORF type:complete len:313 (+),score=63.53 TRINITY_DN8137_c1_g1_i3:46-984(+)